MTKLHKPDTLLFDMDDVLADVTGSYRGAVIKTAALYGVTLTFDDIMKAKAAGNANDEWVMTRRMLKERGVIVSLKTVTDRFEEFYQGTPGTPGLKETETLLVDKAYLEKLAETFKMGIVTGRPRKDAHVFLQRQNIQDIFQTVVTADDGPLKPDPAPVKLALRLLNATDAWMFGDTPDDIKAAVSAGVTGIGVVAPSDDPVEGAEILKTAGASRVITQLTQIDELLKSC